MPVDLIRYDLLTQDALRGVIRTVLEDAAANGLPGDHHFFVTFDTRAEGVKMSARLRESYPDDMTIVLQHQFWDLKVLDDEFEVGLAFNGIPERLFVPLKAVKSFFDPSVQFGLQFTTDGDELTKRKPSAGDGAEQPSLPGIHPQVSAAPPRPKKKVPGPERPPVEPEPVKSSDDTSAAPDDDVPPPASGGPGGEVVRFDRFRKK